MNQFDPKIESCLNNALDSKVPSIRFTAVWDRYKKNSPKIFGIKRVIAVPLMALILLMVGFTFAAQVDKTDYPFVNDPNVIGKWQAVDYVDSVDQFTPGPRFYKDELFLKELAFIKDGSMLWASSNTNNKLEPASFRWTQGFEIDKQDRTASKYELKEINGSTYMFLEWKDGGYIYLHLKPTYFILKKVDNLDYTIDYSKLPAKEDKVDYPFVDDPQLIGKWEAVDYVKTIDEFDPRTRITRGDLILSHQFDITENGKMSVLLPKHKVYEGYTWTKGLLLDKKFKTASKYEIRKLKGDTYLFYEFKNGNYTYDGKEPQYNVLKKLK